MKKNFISLFCLMVLSLFCIPLISRAEATTQVTIIPPNNPEQLTHTYNPGPITINLNVGRFYNVSQSSISFSVEIHANPYGPKGNRLYYHMLCYSNITNLVADSTISPTNGYLYTVLNFDYTGSSANNEDYYTCWIRDTTDKVNEYNVWSAFMLSTWVNVSTINPTNPPPTPPSGGHYSCNATTGICELNSHGSFTNSNCDNKCIAINTPTPPSSGNGHYWNECINHACVNKYHNSVCQSGSCNQCYPAGNSCGLPPPQPVWQNESLPHALLYGYREVYKNKDSHCISSTNGKPQICSTQLQVKSYFNTYQSDTYPPTGQFTPQTVCMDPTQGKDKYHTQGKTPGVIVDFTPVDHAKQYNLIYWINDQTNPRFHELLIPATRGGHMTDWVFLPDAFGEDVAFTKGATVGMKIAVWDGDTFNGYSDIVRFTSPTCTKPFPTPTGTVTATPNPNVTITPTGWPPTTTVSPTCIPYPTSCLNSGFERCQLMFPISRYCLPSPTATLTPPPPSPTTTTFCPKPDAPQSFVIGSTGASQFIAGSWVIANPMADATYSLVYQAQTNGKAGILPGFKNGNTYQAFTTLPTTNSVCGQVNANVEYTSSSCGTVDGPSISAAGPACQ